MTTALMSRSSRPASNPQPCILPRTREGRGSRRVTMTKQIPSSCTSLGGHTIHRVPAGPGMLRRARRVARLTGCFVEVISRQGRIVAVASSYTGPWRTWAGGSQRVPRFKSMQWKQSRRSGARHKTGWKGDRPNLEMRQRREADARRREASLDWPELA